MAETPFGASPAGLGAGGLGDVPARDAGSINMTGVVAMIQLLAKGQQTMIAELQNLIAALPVGAYSTGLWVPTLLGSTVAGAPTYTAQVGTYFRVGNLVTAMFNVAISAVGGMTGNLLMGALPATSATGTLDVGTLSLAQMTGITLNGGYTMIAGDVPNNGSQVRFLQNGTGVAVLAQPIAGVAATTVLAGLVTYRAV